MLTSRPRVLITDADPEQHRALRELLEQHGCALETAGDSSGPLSFTERADAEHRIRRLIRTYAVLSAINQLIVRERDSQALLEAACTIAVEKGGFHMAWIGLLDQPPGRVKPVAVAGNEHGYLHAVGADLADLSRHASATAAALRTGEHQVCNDLQTDPRFSPWREAAAERGYRACAAFPLELEGRVVGNFNLYSTEVGFFDAEELRLLDELATDIAFALDVNRREAERRAAEERITRQRATLIDLTSRDTLGDACISIAWRQIAEAAAETLGVGRVGIWRYTADRSAIECADLFERATGRHSAGSVLAASRHPAYFHALETAEVIAAADAINDPQTREFSDDYLKPLGIGAMLDVPIRVGGRREGVLCLEHLGRPRTWTADEKTFGVAMASLVSLALESAERRSAQRAAAEKNEVLQKIFDNVPVMLCVLDAGGRMMLANREFEHALGWTVREIQQHPDILSEWYPDAAERSRAEDWIRAGTGQFGELRTRARSGSVLATHFANVRLSDGTSIGIGLDMTERERSASALRASEERFRELAETILDVFWVTDPRTQRVLYVSPAYDKIWGRPGRNLHDSASAWAETLHPDDREQVVQAARTKAARGEYDETYRVVRPDGQVRWIRDRAFPVRNAEGTVERVVGVARDVTEQRQLEEQLRQSQKMEAIGRLAGGVAHDFNNILAAILMQAELTATDDLPADAREGLAHIRSAAERAAKLTRQLLLFSRREVMQPRELDLNDTVTNLARMLQRIIGEDVRLQLQLHPAPLLLRADAGMLDQVLLNLAVNARDAMSRGGRLLIETREAVIRPADPRDPDAPPGAYVLLRMSDTGCGIPADVLPRIFEPFFTTKEIGKGTGLGLPTVFGIVKQHRGWIDVSSESGSGTTFEIFLPACPDATVSSAVDAGRTEIEAPALGSETVLMAEDDTAVRSLTRATLERYGYRVLEAANADEAIQLWSQHQASVALLLTDLVMPGMSGQQLAERLQQDDPGLHVIFTSGYSAEIAGRELELRPGENFVQKPFLPAQLLDIVRRSLEA